MTRKAHRNGWRLLKATPVVTVRVNQITGDLRRAIEIPGLGYKCELRLRTLRRMLH